MIKTEKQIITDALEVIANYNRRVETAANSSAEIRIIQYAKHLNGVYLILFSCDGYDACAVAYDNGSIFVQSDWRGSHPENFDEIENYRWIDAETLRQAVVINGLPEIL